MIKKIYIASSSKFIEECKKLSNLLETRFNIQITRKWWEYYISDKEEFTFLTRKEFNSEPIIQMIRDLDFKAIRQADLVIIYGKDFHKLTGAMIECGYAIAHKKIVIILGEIKRCTMLSGCIHVNNRAELFELIKRDMEINK